MQTFSRRQARDSDCPSPRTIRGSFSPLPRRGHKRVNLLLALLPSALQIDSPPGSRSVAHGRFMTHLIFRNLSPRPRLNEGEIHFSPLPRDAQWLARASDSLVKHWKKKNAKNAAAAIATTAAQGSDSTEPP